MRLNIRHETRYDYAEAASGAVMRLRLKPRTSNGQTVEKWSVSVNDAPITRWISTSYGDMETVWRSDVKIDKATIVAEGVVETHDRAGVFLPEHEDVNPLCFLRSTPLTTPDAAIRAIAEEIRQGNDLVSSLHAMCALAHDRIDYRTGVTTATTTAAEALAQGSGVCQDQAHLFVAVARLLGAPARYVTGYLLDPDREGDAHDPHGWAEALVPGIGWIGFDCTLKLCPTDRHVRLTCGLDANDAAPLTGVALLAGAITVDADVHMTNLASSGQSQSQTQQ